MDEQRSTTPPLLSAIAIVVSLIFTTGCWEKIEYTGEVNSPTPTAVKSKTTHTAEILSEQSTSPGESRLQDTDPTDPFQDEAPLVDADLFSDTSSMFDPAEQETIAIEEEGTKPGIDWQPPTINPDPELTEESSLPFQSPSATLNSRQLVWKLGYKLCLAGLQTANLNSEASGPNPLQEANAIADQLDVELPDLPDSLSLESQEVSVQEVLKAMLPLGRKIGQQLKSKFDREHVLLFEVGFKSCMLLVLYSPDSTLVDALADTITEASKGAKLPSNTSQPLIEALRRREPVLSVEARVLEQYQDILQHLGN